MTHLPTNSREALTALALASGGSTRPDGITIPCHPYTLEVLFDDHNLSLKLFDQAEITAWLGGKQEWLTDPPAPLLQTLERPFPQNIRRFRDVWQNQGHQLDNSLRLTATLAVIFSILLPDEP